jgi:hypothetical protein
MPIAFPPFIRGPNFRKAANLLNSGLDQIPSPNLGRVGAVFTAMPMSGYGSAYENAVNVREFGVVFRAPTNTSIVNPVVTKFTDDMAFDRVMGNMNMVLSGVSRDSTGVALGGCQVLVFRTSDKVLVAETVSDGSGLWSIPMMEAGAMFLVQYKEGGTPVAGTSLNTLKAVPL